MEIINGYSASMSLGTTVFDNVTTETSSYSLTSNIHFFSGTFDPDTLYNYTTTESMLSAYASQYLGSVNSVPMTLTYDDNTKKRVITQTSPNARRFKDPRYINNTYALGTAFTKPTIGTKYKFKFTNSTAKDGFLVNGGSISTNVNKDYYRTYTDGFDTLFANGTSVSGGAIDLVNNRLYGYRVENGTGPIGYLSVPFSILKIQGLSVIECNVALNQCGLTFVGSSWNNRLTSSYGSSPTKITINFNNMTVTNSFPYEGANTAVIDISSMDLSNLYIGICGFQAYSGWVNWDVVILNTYYSYDIESDFFTTTENITITNPNVMTHSGFEVIPYGDDDKPLTNQITWCAIDIGSNRIIYTDDIGVRDNPSFINLNSLTSTYGRENIVNSIKIEYRNKSQGEIL